MRTFFDITGKRCLITGAGSGIGQAIAERLAQAGAELWLIDINADQLAAVRQSIESYAMAVRCDTVDVGDAAACSEWMLRVCGRWTEGPDVLINNAGIGHKGAITETTLEDVQRLSRVNVEGVFNLCRAALPAMIRRRSGCIINLASIGGVVGIRDRLAYCTTKFAVVGMTKAMALDHAQDNIRINCICPARVHTPFVDRIIESYDDPAAAFAAMSETQPLGRMARPDEIAAAAHYLASDEAAFITGTAFQIDGGFSAGK